MHENNLTPKDPMDWGDVKKYANDLLKNGIFTKKELVELLNSIENLEPNYIYNRLINEASKKLIERFEDDEDDIGVSFRDDSSFIGLDLDDELELLSNKRNNKLRSISRSVLKFTGVTIILGETIDIFSDLFEGDLLIESPSYSFPRVAIIIMGALLVKKSGDII